MAVATPRATWLVGMPEYRLSFADRSIPSVPLGAVDAARAVLYACADEGAFHRRIEEEYLSVLAALLEAGMPFRILNLREATTPLAERLRREGYPDFHMGVPPQGSTYTYPRDLMVYLADRRIALVSDGWLKPGAGDRDGVTCWASCCSEGGRVLVSGDTLVLFRHPAKEKAPGHITLDKLRERGMAVVEIPAGIFCAADRDGDLSVLFHDWHIDRVAGLVRGRDGGLHLILGPGYVTGTLETPLGVADSADLVRAACGAADIAVHVLPDGEPPYAASLVQSPEGRVVLSGGSDAALELVGRLAGPENVVSTAIPLTHFPVFASAGIHCLVTESPEFLLAPRPHPADAS